MKNNSLRILIIATYYPPDTAIAAKRPYQLAENLTAIGNQVTVLRSGIINRIPDPEYKKNEKIRVISYLGENSPAESYERGMFEVSGYSGNKSRISFLPFGLRMKVSKAYHRIMRPAEFRSLMKTYRSREGKLKTAIDAMVAEGATFDIVFSTYGDMENLFGGEYAAEVFGCKWIMDFRDPVAQKDSQQWWEYRYRLKKQRRAVEKADACTVVSKGLARQISDDAIVLYNGFSPRDKDDPAAGGSGRDILDICYAGAVYSFRLEAIEELFKAIKVLADQGVISRKRVRLTYAGGNSDDVIHLAAAYDLAEIVEDHGYVGRKEVLAMEADCDLFLVLSWNTNDEQGVLTGKFYEGIDAGKPILSVVVGNKENSELFELCEEYDYGFCYEKCSGEAGFRGLCDYLADSYMQKMENGCVEYNASEEFAGKFRYDNLAEEFDEICHRLIGETNN